MSSGDAVLHGITVDYSRDNNYDIIGLERLRDSYMQQGETSPQERLAYVSYKFSSNLEHAQRLYDYSSQFWFGYATPILSFGRNGYGLPISCFLNTVTDSKEGLVDTQSETNWLSMMGGGVGVYWGIRGQDEKSVGVIPHMKIYDDSTLAYKQGTTRRGSYAMYLDISHPDIVEFLEMRKETGDPRRKCLNLHYGVNIPNTFMKLIENSMKDIDFDDSWELKDPSTGKVHDTISARYLWGKILELRAGQGRGEPYIHFIDHSNDAIDPHLKAQGYDIKQSNLCLVGNTNISIRQIDNLSNNTAPDQNICLDDFVELFQDNCGSTQYQVKSYNTNGEVEWATVSNAGQTGIVQELIEVEDEQGNVIRCTPDHLIMTLNRGWVKAGELVETDQLVSI